jgi:hypothetical protein
MRLWILVVSILLISGFLELLEVGDDQFFIVQPLMNIEFVPKVVSDDYASESHILGYA